MEARAVALIGRKQRAAKLLYGENDAGLSDLTGGDDAGDLIAELAKSLDGDDSITDLRDLFKAASSAEEARESLWATATPEPEIMIETEEEATEEPAILIKNWPQHLPEPVEPQSPKPKRRRKLSLSDAPQPLPMFEENTAKAAGQTAPMEQFIQLALF